MVSVLTFARGRVKRAGAEDEDGSLRLDIHKICEAKIYEKVIHRSIRLRGSTQMALWKKYVSHVHKKPSHAAARGKGSSHLAGETHRPKVPRPSHNAGAGLVRGSEKFESYSIQSGSSEAHGAVTVP